MEKNLESGNLVVEDQLFRKHGLMNKLSSTGKISDMLRAMAVTGKKQRQIIFAAASKDLETVFSCVATIAIRCKRSFGDKYVYEYMMQNGCRIGGEQSGHIIFSKYASTGDGILTSLKMMEVIMARKKKLSELTADLAIYPQVLENVRVHDKAAAQADVDVQAAVESVAEALGDTGRILVRESGTEPLLRVMVEAESEELCRKYVDQVVEIVRKKGHVAE